MNLTEIILGVAIILNDLALIQLARRLKRGDFR